MGSGAIYLPLQKYFGILTTSVVALVPSKHQLQLYRSLNICFLSENFKSENRFNYVCRR